MNRLDYPEALAALGSNSVRMAECIKITRRDGEIFRFTGYSEPVIVNEADDLSYLYQSAKSFGITALDLADGLAVTNMDLNAILDDDAITSKDILTGKFDHARVDLFIAVWDVSGTIWQLPLRVSWIGEINHQAVSFKGDLRGLAQRLSDVYTDTTSLECRYLFGDDKCRVDLTEYTTATTIAVVDSGYTTVTVADDVSGKRLLYGKIVFKTGLNAGYEYEIVRQAGSSVTLFLPADHPIAVGDEVDVVEGCSKTRQRCVEYDNIQRFGGEPFLRGDDVFGKYPNAEKGDADTLDGGTWRNW